MRVCVFVFSILLTNFCARRRFSVLSFGYSVSCTDLRDFGSNVHRLNILIGLWASVCSFSSACTQKPFRLQNERLPSHFKSDKENSTITLVHDTYNAWKREGEELTEGTREFAFFYSLLSLFLPLSVRMSLSGIECIRSVGCSVGDPINSTDSTMNAYTRL